MLKKVYFIYIKDIRHPVTSSFSDSPPQHGDFNALWQFISALYGVYICDGLNVASFYRLAGPEFECCTHFFSSVAVKFKKLIFRLNWFFF